MIKSLSLTLLLLIATQPVFAERIKDIATVAGVRSNQLVGYGVVIGLDGTGDQTSQTPFTVQSLKNMLGKFGVNLPPGTTLQPKNIAAVMVHASLPPFSKPGQSIDVTVSSIGNAKSLRGGSLLMTPLKGVDGEVYALAQGNLVVSGLGAEGADGSKITINVPSVGRIPNGATIERSVNTPFGETNSLVLNLHQSDFTTAHRVSKEINNVIGPGTAKPIDASSIRVNAPRDMSQRVSFVSLLEGLEVAPDSAPARIIVNSRTGTVVIGQNVRVMPAAVAHGSLTVTITESARVSQPAPLSTGQTAVVPESDIEIEQQADRMFLFEPGVSLDEIVRAVNQVGAAPGDLVAILEALKEAGALRADLIVI
ncbi:MAG: flagellar basal body P-ring protein FlgI [Thioalkalispiraceae bacterium]